jgi:hypothetical protein
LVLLIQGNFTLHADVLRLDAVLVIKPSTNSMELCFTYTTRLASVKRERVVLAKSFFITSGHNKFDEIKIIILKAIRNDGLKMFFIFIKVRSTSSEENLGRDSGR